MFDPKLLERYWAKVQKTDTCWLWTAARDTGGYGRFSEHGVLTGAHQFSYKLHTGPLDSALVIDHMCHVKNCVNPAHLRQVTQKVNVEAQGMSRRNKSGFRGVHWNKVNRKWVAMISHHNKTYNLGSFDNLEEAAQVAKAKREELFA